MTAQTPLSSALDDQAYLRRFREKIVLQRVPYTGSIDLTHRCNLRCVHCYVGDQSVIAGSRQRELETPEWLGVIDQAVEAGCMDLLITGGEPMLRSDFAEVYAHAKNRGMILTVFTNATQVSPRILDLFADLPPRLVEVTVYGATAATHDRVTQVPGSFDRTIRGIEALVGRGIRVGMKTILMTLNADEYYAMEDLALQHGARWRLDASVFPCLPNADSGGRPNRCETGPAPLDLRLDPARAAELGLSSPERRKILRDTYEKMRGRRPTDKLYTCGAGLTGFHIDPYGWLQPCMLTTAYRSNVLSRGFAAAWEEIRRIRDVKAAPGYECNACDLQPICSGCPAFFDLENGAPDVKSEYVCTLTKHRFGRISAQEEIA